MKPFGVAVYQDKRLDGYTYYDGEALFNPDMRKLTGKAWASLEHGDKENRYDSTLHWVDTEDDAVQLAGILSRRNPGKKVLWFRTNGQFLSKPQEPKMSLITDKGILPA